MTNEAGEFALLEPGELELLRGGRLTPGARRDELARKGFLAEPEGLAHVVRRLRERRGFLNRGPHLHIAVLTLRCDHRCVYCHASRSSMDDNSVDMSRETAERVVDFALETTSPWITLEFQGGEPLANFESLRYMVDLAIERAAKRRKTLDLSLVTNLSLMDEEKAAFLLDRRVQICTSLDGPADLHDQLRPRKDGSGHALAVRWIERLNDMYRQRGLDPDLYHVDALVTVARPSLERARDIVDEYVRLGLKTIHFRPLNPLGAARSSGSRYGYRPEEFLRFYREGLAYIVEKNRRGVELQEKTASVFLKKIFESQDPGFLDIRSPCGGAIGQLAYDSDGTVYTCDEGRMLGRMGDPAFRVGHVESDSYGAALSSSAARVVCLASCLEGSAACLACAYRPYCGTCPVLNYSEQGTPFGVIPASERCQIHRGILDEIFGLLATEDEELNTLLARWRLSRPRPELVHRPPPSCPGSGQP